MESVVIIIFFFAALIRSGLGFGDALFAMPLLSMTLGLELATPILAVDALLISLLLAAIERKMLRFNLLKSFLISAVFGVPVGILFLINLDESILKLVLGFVILTFSFYKLLSKNSQIKLPIYTSYIFGFISGMLGGAYNTNGPPAIFYAANNFPTEEFKANLQGMLFPVNLIIISGHIISGLWSYETFKLFSVSLIPITIGTFLGIIISKKIPKDLFTKIIWICLIIISLNLIINNL